MNANIKVFSSRKNLKSLKFTARREKKNLFILFSISEGTNSLNNYLINMKIQKRISNSNNDKKINYLKGRIDKKLYRFIN
jgi:hypothetical protein